MITKYLNKLIPKGFRFTSSDRQNPYNYLYYSYNNVELGKDGLPLFWSKQFDFDNEKPSTDEVIYEGFAQNPYSFVVINRLSQIASSLHRDLYNKNTDELFEDDELEQLLKKPNQLNSYDDFYYRIHASLRSTGECFICGIAPTGFSRYSSLIVPTPKNVTIIEDNVGMPEKYEVEYFNRTYTFLPSDVLHITNQDITEDCLYGFSHLNANRFVYKSNNEVWSSEYWLHKNKGVSGIISNDGNRALTPKEQQELQAEYDRTSTGTNFGKVKVSSTPLKYIKMGANPADLKSIEARLDHLRQLCSTQNVASQLFGDPASSTYNNVSEMKVAMYEDSILPMCRKIDKELSEWLIQTNYGYNDVYIKVDESKIKVLNKPNQELSNKVLNEVQAGVLPVEVARHILYEELFPMPENLDELVKVEEIQEDIGNNEVDSNEDGGGSEPNLNEQAQASLRGSVGGVQGILEVQAAVAAGLTQYDAALTLFTTVYGFDESTARELLGEERTIEIEEETNEEEINNSNQEDADS